MITISDDVYQKVFNTQGVYYEALSRVPADKLTRDFLSTKKPTEQLAILSRYLEGKTLKNAKLLEVGSGLGIFNAVARVEYGIDAWGVEPDGDGFDNSFNISLQILKENNLQINNIVNASGENLPFEDNTFDIVYSTNVLEHVNDPRKVIEECIRVAKTDGIIQIVVPNFGSFFDGHYACLYFPYQPKWFWTWWLKNILKRNPKYAKTIRTEINYFYVEKLLKTLRYMDIETLSLGQDVFRERMKSNESLKWAGLNKMQRWLTLLKKLHITNLATEVLVHAKAFSPLIITMRKKAKIDYFD